MLHLRSTSDLRQEIHSLSHRLRAFNIVNRSKADWERFYAATDALLDIETAFDQFFSLGRTQTILERIGFLQALAIHQDAVEELSKSVSLKWSPYDVEALRSIRALRIRIAGHPVWSDRVQGYQRSSAMHDLSDCSTDRFNVVLYYEDGSETKELSFIDLYTKNVEALLHQLSEIRSKMLALESAFESNSGSRIR